MPMAVIQLFTTTITMANRLSTMAGTACSWRRCRQRVSSSGSNSNVETPCRIRIDRSLCRCGVIAAQRFTGISSEQRIR